MTAETDRTSHVPKRRADGLAAKVAGTVPSGPLPQSGKGRPLAVADPIPCSMWGHRQSEVPRPDGRQRPLVPHDTSARPARTTATPTSVYRYYDGDGRLIYVGVTSRGPQRQAQHAVTAEWWPHVRAQDVEHYPDRETALRREKWLIERHHPPFNRQHNPEHETRRAGYLELIVGRCGHCFGCLEDAKNPDDPEPYGCRMGEDREDSPPCRVCGSHTCIYEDGAQEAGVEGYYKGMTQGCEQTWKDAHALYAAIHEADVDLRMVVDESRRMHGRYYVPRRDIDEAMAAMAASIAERGVTALVDEVAARDPWARQEARV